MSLVSTETGESVGFMPTSPITPTSLETAPTSFSEHTPEKRHGKHWFPVLAPVWGSAQPTEQYNYLASTTTLDQNGGPAEPQPEATAADAISTHTANSSVDNTRLTARVGGIAAQTRESLAAWDEDMPLPTPPLASEERFGDPTDHIEPSSPYSTGTSPLRHSPSFHHTPKGSPRSNNAVIDSQFSLASGTSSAMADYDSDGSDASDDGMRGDASPFGRTSFGCDERDDDATEDRARKLREAFFVNPTAGRSHTSLTSVEDRSKTPTHIRGGSDDANMGGLAGLRSAVLTQPMARHSVESLHEAAASQPPRRELPLRKKSLTNLLRKREEQARQQERGDAKKLPALPAAVEADEYYVDPNPQSVYNVCNQKYLRKSLLSPPEPEVDEVFDVWRPPSQRRLWEAGTCTIRNEDGNLIPFSDLFPKWEDAPANGPPPRVMLVFLRHFWCGPCQDYTLESISTLDTKMLAANNIKVYVLGSGHWKLLKPYRQLFRCPFPFFTDGPRRLYSLLGMIKHASYLPFKYPWSDAERGGYNHRPLMKQAVAGFKNAFLHMPLANPGNWTQLGGEFILSPGYKCDFAHRMTTMASELCGTSTN
jgi:hypothetical protein